MSEPYDVTTIKDIGLGVRRFVDRRGVETTRPACPSCRGERWDSPISPYCPRCDGAGTIDPPPAPEAAR